MAKQTRRGRGRRRGAAARANNDLDAHIESLGLEGVEAYKRWCHERGFTAALNKSWQERRRERATAERDKESAKALDEVAAHVEKLALQSVEQYQCWCREQGLGDSLYKSAAQRRKELDLAQRLRGEAALAKVKKRVRRSANAIAQVCAGQLDIEELHSEELRGIHRACAALDAAARAHFCDLLLWAEKRARPLLSMRPVLDRLGPIEGNSFIEALAALAAHGADWHNSPSAAKAESRNGRRQLASLSRFLLATYEVPACMDSVWYRGTGEVAQKQQAWFKHVGAGGNMRRAELPLQFSKRMAHVFLQAPNRLLVEEALRWAQVVGWNGSEELAEAVLATDLGLNFADEEFWSTVVLFLTENPMLDPSMVGPLVDYIRAQRFAPQLLVGDDGEVVAGPPLQPGYTMKGRSAVKLLDQVEEWHQQLARENRQPAGTWQATGIGALDWTDDKSGVRWFTDELLSGKELAYEGRQMHHCVASYARNCQRGSKSIWSLQAEDGAGGRMRVLTIAVHNPSRNIVEVRGKYNAVARRSAKNPQNQAFEKRYRELLAQSGRAMREWMQQEELGRTNRSY